MRLVVEALQENKFGIFAMTDWENGKVIYNVMADWSDFGEKMDEVFRDIPEIDGVLFLGPEEIVDKLAAPLLENEDSEIQVVIEHRELTENIEKEEEAND